MLWVRFCIRLSAAMPLLLLIILQQNLPAEIYKWTDKEGVIHFQDIPPTNLSASTVVEIISVPKGIENNFHPVEGGIEYYDIQGNSREELMGQLGKLGLKTEGGQNAAGVTVWRLRSRFNTVLNGRKWHIESPEVSADITIKLPRWLGFPSASSDLKIRWKNFFQALKRHEEKHKEDAMRCAEEAQKALSAIGPMSDRDQLLKAANTACNRTTEKYMAISAEFDARTSHGIKEGCVL